MIWISLFFVLLILNTMALLVDFWILNRLKQRHRKDWECLAGAFLVPKRFIRWIHSRAHESTGDVMLSRMISLARFVHLAVLTCVVALIVGLFFL